MMKMIRNGKRKIFRVSLVASSAKELIQFAAHRESRLKVSQLLKEYKEKRGCMDHCRGLKAFVNSTSLYRNQTHASLNYGLFLSK